MVIQKKNPSFRPAKVLAESGVGRTIACVDENNIIFSQGEPANSMFYIQKGKIKLTVVSKSGKESVIAVLGTGDFFGEGCLSAHPHRLATATAMMASSIMRLDRAAAVEVLKQEVDTWRKRPQPKLIKATER